MTPINPAVEGQRRATAVAARMTRTLRVILNRVCMVFLYRKDALEVKHRPTGDPDPFAG